MTDGAHWYDVDGNPVSIERAEELLSSLERIIAQDTVGDLWVSTVHLVLDHNLGRWASGAEPCPPLIFETAVFRGHTDSDLGPMIDYWRTSTKFAALACHDQVCAAVRDGVDLDNLLHKAKGLL